MTTPVQTDQNLRAVLKRIAVTCSEPARLLELCYWSEEPELLAVLRHYVNLPEKARDALRAFLAITADCPETVDVRLTAEGHVRLASPVLSGRALRTLPLPPHDAPEEWTL
ncbi:MAG TPA: hypothetical protein VG270_03225 [Pseudolabrys sp.]|jgi:hypothetical protein|nr:hypothetical protein [Pseudolabrys sp.]